MYMYTSLLLLPPFLPPSVCPSIQSLNVGFLEVIEVVNTDSKTKAEVELAVSHCHCAVCVCVNVVCACCVACVYVCVYMWHLCERTSGVGVCIV